MTLPFRTECICMSAVLFSVGAWSGNFFSLFFAHFTSLPKQMCSQCKQSNWNLVSDWTSNKLGVQSIQSYIDLKYFSKLINPNIYSLGASYSCFFPFGNLSFWPLDQRIHCLKNLQHSRQIHHWLSLSLHLVPNCSVAGTMSTSRQLPVMWRADLIWHTPVHGTTTAVAFNRAVGLLITHPQPSVYGLFFMLHSALRLGLRGPRESPGWGCCL